MSWSKTRIGDLKKVFRNGDCDLLNEIGALCILFEDFRHELTCLHAHKVDLTQQIPPRQLHEMLYYVRRSLVTIDEVRARLQKICGNAEFRTAKDLMEERDFAAVDDARRYLTKAALLKQFRNYMGAHIDPNRVVQSSIRNKEPDSMSSMGWKETDTDFGLQLDFATHILEGAIASNLPGGTALSSENMAHFFETLMEAWEHVRAATYVLTRRYLWDRFGTV